MPVDEEEESEGAQADAEYGGLRTVSGSTGWVNDSRRRSVHHSGSTRKSDVEELRRHSMAV